ncbi:MAG: SDR family oxidoreductase [Burkholderiales bacterium]|jgi:gluconate 5-dehydrogenase|nr:SDR family oxidoreductase [Burkholderiales bacterium]MEB2335884.1 SDR family oxidoreductase [Burkholderiales bacterium]HMM52091.1 SDR family oxidoreductase [Burkholderiaceae bacterium]
MSVKQAFDLGGRKAIVTGGSRGLGLQIAEALGEMGAEVLLAARKQDELDAAVAHLAKTGVKAHALAADLGRPEAVQAFADAALARLGHCDILVNNAGATWGAPAAEHPLEAWQKLVNLNLTGVFLLTQEIGRRSMIPRRYGRILIVASIAGLRGNPPGTNHTIAYNTTKGGLVNFTRALAGEWGEHGITVNALAPGFFPSKMTRATLAAIEDRVKERTPLHRLGDDEDLKGAAVLFCSDAGKHITGQILAVDGGVTAV